MGLKPDASANSWGPETHLEDQTGLLPASSWKIAMDGGGEAIAVWVEYNTQGEDHFDFYENRYTPSDGWEGERLVTYIFYDTVLDLALAMDDTGTAVLVWSQWVDSENTHLYAKRYTWSTDTWDAERPIENTDPGHTNYPRLAMDGRGNAVAVWGYTNPDSISFPYANHYD